MYSVYPSWINLQIKMYWFNNKLPRKYVISNSAVALFLVCSRQKWRHRIVTTPQQLWCGILFTPIEILKLNHLQLLLLFLTHCVQIRISHVVMIHPCLYAFTFSIWRTCGVMPGGWWSSSRHDTSIRAPEWVWAGLLTSPKRVSRRNQLPLPLRWTTCPHRRLHRRRHANTTVRAFTWPDPPLHYIIR